MGSSENAKAAAGALADLFFRAPSLSEAEEVRANNLRRKYRDWRQSVGTVPHGDILDLNHEAMTNEVRSGSGAKMRRVKTVGARLNGSSSVRRAHACPCASAKARARRQSGRASMCV